MSATQTGDHVPIVTTPSGKKKAAGNLTSSARSERLSALAEAAPKFKSGQIQGLWPQITDAVARGHKLKQIWECLSHDGLEVSYSRFRHVIADLKRSHPTDDRFHPRPERSTKLGPSTEVTERDPAANLRDRLNKRPGFEFDERPPDLKKLV